MKKLDNALLCEVVGGWNAADDPVIPKEIVGIATGVAIGGGVGASFVIEGAGGFSAIGSLGTAATATFSAAGGALVASFGAGYMAGSALYQNSETVQNVAQAAVGAVLNAGDALWNVFSGDLTVRNGGNGGTVWEENFPVSGVQLGGALWENNFPVTDVHL